MKNQTIADRIKIKNKNITPVVSFCHNKGGTGKTSISLALARYLANRNVKVLALDLDTSGNNSMSFTLTHNVADTGKHITQAFTDDSLKKHIERNEEYNLDFVRSDERSVDINNASVEKLKKMIDEVKQNYDVVIIDSKPDLAPINFAVWRASQKIIVPTHVEIYAIKSLELIFKKMEQEHIDAEIGVLINCFSPSKTDNPATLKNMAYEIIKNSSAGVNILNTEIPKLPSIQKMQLKPDAKLNSQTLNTLMFELTKEIFDIVF